MHYTSWGRRGKTDGRTELPLLVGEGPEELGRFTDTGAGSATAVVDGEEWTLSFDPRQGATAMLADGAVFRAPGDFRRGKRLEIDLAGRRFTFLNEGRSDWIVEDANSEKIAQFSGGGRGTIRSILEFENEGEGTDLSRREIAGLSWFTRLALESRLENSSVALIGTLALASVVAVLAFLV